MYTNTLEENHRISKNYDSMWIPGSNKYYMKKPALNYRNNNTESLISGRYAVKALSTLLLS